MTKSKKIKPSKNMIPDDGDSIRVFIEQKEWDDLEIVGTLFVKEDRSGVTFDYVNKDCETKTQTLYIPMDPLWILLDRNNSDHELAIAEKWSMTINAEGFLNYGGDLDAIIEGRRVASKVKVIDGDGVELRLGALTKYEKQRAKHLIALAEHTGTILYGAHTVDEPLGSLVFNEESEDHVSRSKKDAVKLVRDTRRLKTKDGIRSPKKSEVVVWAMIRLQ